MLFPSQVKLFLFQTPVLALNTIPPPPPSGLTQVLLSLGSPPRALQIWLGHPYYILKSLFRISTARTSIHGQQREALYHHTIRFSLPYVSPAETEIHCREEVWNRPMTGKDIVASFDPSNVFRSKNLQHQLFLLWNSKLKPPAPPRRLLLAP